MQMQKSALAVGEDFELALSTERLTDIVENKMRTTELAPYDAYEKLSDANKLALKHLVRAAVIFDRVFHKQEHPDTIRAGVLLRKEAVSGNVQALYALTAYTMFNGIEGMDHYAAKATPLPLFKNKSLKSSKAFYPQDITKEEVADYILAHPEQASALLGNNTIVVRQGNRLSALPYSVVFRSEMESAAREMLMAAAATDHAGLAEYLRMHAQALANDSDPELVFKADKLWINLEDAPLEFTIERESYRDLFSSTIAADPRVSALLKEHGIVAKQKDLLGARVGIINGESYDQIALYRHYVDVFREKMPLHDSYRDAATEISQKQISLADVDLVCLSGLYAAFRDGLTIAQKLPNDDKLAAQQVGSRLVFHRQTRRDVFDPAQLQELLDALVHPAQKSLYNADASFLFVVGHELAHSLGPSSTLDGRNKNSSLGKWGSAIEENKADLGSLVMADYLASIGKLTVEQANKIYMTWAIRLLPSARPAETQAHLLRSLMQLNYFRGKGALLFESEGKLKMVPEKMPIVAYQMLTEVISLQLAGDASKADAYAQKYTAWNEACQYSADTQAALKPKRYRMYRQPLRDLILAQ
jgi:hypothetical protein